MTRRRRRKEYRGIDSALDFTVAVFMYIINFLFRGSYRRRVIQDFFEHVRILVDRRLPLAEGVERYAESRRQSAIRYTFRSVTDRLRAGEPFWAALRDHSPTFFPADAVAMVRAGEECGMLGKALGNVVEDMTFHRDIKVRFTYMCVYLFAVMISGVFWAGVIFMFVLPRFAEIWAGSGVEVPAPTRFLLDPAGFEGGGKYVVLLACFVPVAIAGVYFLSRFELGVPSWVAFAIPGLRGAFRRHQRGRFLSALGMNLLGKTPTDEAVAAAAEVSRLGRIRRTAARAGSAIREGIPMGEALGRMGVLREGILWRIRSAERRGGLPETLLAMGSEEQEAAHRSFLYLLAWVRPISVILIGAIEFLVVIGMYMPLFDIVHLISMDYL